MRFTLIIDSNIWAYYFDRESREHHLVAPIVDEAVKTQPIVVNTVIVMELGHFLVKNLGTVEGSEKMKIFLGLPFAMDNLDYPHTLRALELLGKYTHRGIGGRDATLLATAERLSVTRLMTHDDAFKKIDWIKVVDPVSKGS